MARTYDGRAMHRHLLVPIDGSDLTTEMVGRAVEYARGAGARITFFHAHPDPSASLSGEPDAVRLVSPESYQYTYVGRARELLAKAESAARAQGVPCESRSATSGSPHQAILALTPIPATGRKLALVWGLHCVLTDDPRDLDDMVSKACHIAYKEGFANPGERVIISAGVPLGTPGATNMLRIAYVGDDGYEGL